LGGGVGRCIEGNSGGRFSFDCPRLE
jgi:hypothetical protein